MNSHLHPGTPPRLPMLRIPAPMSEVKAEAMRFPRKKMEIRRLVSDFLYHVDMV